MRISFKENYSSSDILIGLNSKIPAEIRKNSDLSVYKRLVVDRIVFDDYYERSLRLPNGKSGIFAMNHEFLVSSTSKFDVQQGSCWILVELFRDFKNSFYMRIQSSPVGMLTDQELKDKAKVSRICNQANSCVRRAASMLDDGNKLLNFILGIHVQK